MSHPPKSAVGNGRTLRMANAGANVGGRRQLLIRPRWAARITQSCRLNDTAYER